MLIARNGKVGFTKTLGALAPDGPAMPLDAIFRIYSMTKPIVSVAAMMLVEEGRLLITDPLSEISSPLSRTRRSESTTATGSILFRSSGQSRSRT